MFSNLDLATVQALQFSTTRLTVQIIATTTAMPAGWTIGVAAGSFGLDSHAVVTQ